MGMMMIDQTNEYSGLKLEDSQETTLRRDGKKILAQ